MSVRPEVRADVLAERCACGGTLDIRGPLDAWPAQMLEHVRDQPHRDWSDRLAVHDPASSTARVPSRRMAAQVVRRVARHDHIRVEPDGLGSPAGPDGDGMTPQPRPAAHQTHHRQAGASSPVWSGTGAAQGHGSAPSPPSAAAVSRAAAPRSYVCPLGHRTPYTGGLRVTRCEARIAARAQCGAQARLEDEPIEA